MKNTTTVRQDELKVGDKVICHGAIFELTERAQKGEVIWFKTKVVQYANDAHLSQPFPESWQDEWTLQGSPDAKAARVNQ